MYQNAKRTLKTISLPRTSLLAFCGAHFYRSSWEVQPAIALFVGKISLILIFGLISSSRCQFSSSLWSIDKLFPGLYFLYWRWDPYTISADLCNTTTYRSLARRPFSEPLARYFLYINRTEFAGRDNRAPRWLEVDSNYVKRHNWPLHI